MFFVFYVNEVVGVFGFRMGPVSRKTKMCSEAETLGSILPSRERQGLEIELITVADDSFIGTSERSSDNGVLEVLG